MNIVNKIIAAVSEQGIPCEHEFSDFRIDILTKPMCAFVGVKKFSIKEGETVPAVQARVTLQGGESRVDGSLLTETAENVIVPAVKKCVENISKTEISEVKLNAKTGMLYCEIIFETSAPENGEEEILPDIASFKGIRVYAEEYSFSRAALTYETALIGGGTVLHFGGGSTVKIKLSGALVKESGCEDVSAAPALDALLTSGESFSFSYGGAGFGGVMLSKYVCKGGKDGTEKAELEFIGVCGAAAASEEV